MVWAVALLLGALALKPGVDFSNLQPQMGLAAQIVTTTYSQRGYECTITSAADGRHGRRSLHYTGFALDFRVRHIPKRERPALAKAIRRALGNSFDVILFSNHIHTEYDPR